MSIDGLAGGGTDADMTGLLMALASGDTLGFGQIFDYAPGVDPSVSTELDKRREIDLRGLTVTSFSQTDPGSARVIFAPTVGMTFRMVAEGFDGMMRVVSFLLGETGPVNASIHLVLSTDPGAPASLEGSTWAFLDFNQSRVLGGSVVSGFQAQHDVLNYRLALGHAESGEGLR